MIRITNLALINSFLEHDPAFGKIHRADHPDIYFLYERGVGLFPGVMKGDSMSLHACINPECRGKRAVEAAKSCIEWVFSNTKAKRITTRADKTKRHLLIFNGLILTRTHEDETYVYYEVNNGQLS